MTKKIYSVNEHGYYGDSAVLLFPKCCIRNVKELQEKYLEIIYEEGFQEEFQQLLKDYVGRPTPLFFGRTVE